MAEAAVAKKKSSRERMAEYLKGWTPYRYKRYYTFVIATIFSLVIPWIKINGAHFFLLNFDHKQIHLFFRVFDMQELYMMPFLLIFGFLFVFFLTTLGGRVWCGWLCPQTIFRVIYRDLIQTKLLHIRKSIKNKQKEPEGQTGKKAIGVLIWSVLAFIAAADFVWYFVPPEDFFQYIKNPGEHTVMMTTLFIVAGFLIYDVVKLKEDFCIYVCPYARVQSVMYDEETIQTIYNTERGGHIYSDDQEVKLVHNLKELHQKEGENAECTMCDACVRVCPTHIDIKRGTQLECINCLECADACTQVMGALGKPSLITWTSYSAIKEHRKPKFIRFRTIAYGVALTLALVGLFWMGSKKENMLLNINRTTQLYKIKDDGAVTNVYKFLFQNTQREPHTYYFEVESHPEIKIQRPAKPFKLRAGQKSNKIVVLYTKEPLSKDTTKDTPIPIKIKAYATDAKDKIVVERDTIFVFPRYDIWQKKQKEAAANK